MTTDASQEQSCQVQAHFTPKEYKALRSMADGVDLEVGELVRFLSVGPKIRPADRERVRERFSAGGKVKQKAQGKKRNGRFQEVEEGAHRDRMVKVYLTGDEHESLNHLAADNATLRLSAFIRQCALGTRINSRADTVLTNQISSHFGLIKHLISELEKITDPAAREVAFAELKNVRAATLESLTILNSIYRESATGRKGGRS